MSIYYRTAFAAAVALAAASLSFVSAAPAPSTPTDASGDPLPPGVVARLGTLHLRHLCTALAWAPDSQTLASAGWDGTVRIWDAASGKEVRQGRGLQNVNVQALTYLPDGKIIVSKANDTFIRVWDATTGREVRTLFPSQYQAAALAPGPEEATVVALGADATVHVWDLTTGKELPPLELSRGKPQTRTALSADGKRVAGWTMADDVLTVWDATTGKEVFHAAAQLKNMVGLAFAPDGKTVAASGAPGQLVTWDVESGKELRRYADVFLPGLAFAPDGKSVAGLGVGPAVHLWSLTAGKELRKFETPASCGPSWSGIDSLAFSPDGKTVAATQGVVIHLWDVETSKLVHPFTGHTAAVDDVRFTPDGRRLVTCGRDGTARLWDVSLGKEIARWAQTNGSPFTMVGLTDGKSVLATSPSGWQRVELDAENKVVALPGAAPAAWMSGLTLSGDGKTLLGAGPDRSIHLWNVETGKELAPPPIPSKPFGAAAVSPDAKLLAEGGGNASLRLWDVAAVKELRTFGDAPGPGQFRQTVGLSFSPDGKTLLHVGPGELILYEVATGRERMQMIRPGGPFGNAPLSSEGGLARAVFSADGRTVAAGTSGGAMVLLDALTGRELTRLAGRASLVTSIAFSPDDKLLAAGSVDGVVLVWDVKEWTARPRPAPADLKPEKLSSLWESLYDADAGKAYKAMLTLAADPKVSAPYLKEQLSVGDPRAARLIKDLNDDKVEVRDKAQNELAKMEETAIPAVRRALESDPPAESRPRLQDLLDRRKDFAAVEDVRGLRALEALERSGAPEAVGVLEDLAKDAPGAALKQEARAALDRLTRRSAAP